MKAFDAKKLLRLKNAVQSASIELADARDRRVDLLRQFVGANYSANGSDDKIPLPLLAMAVMIYLRLLVSRSPAVMVTTKHAPLKSDASDLELALSQWLIETDFQDFLSRLVMDALFSVGISKSGLESGHLIEIDGQLREAGTPYVDTVDLDDAVWDTSSRTWRETSFRGNYYRLPLEAIKDCELFDKKTRESVTASGVTRRDGGPDNPVDELGSERTSQREGYHETADLIDLYLPIENVILTLPAEGEWKKPLRITDWSGHEDGPYDMLSFVQVPRNILPLPPMSILLDLHDLANRLFNKLGRQAEREKTILGCAMSAGADGKTIIGAQDGAVVNLTSPGQSQEYHFGGPNSTTTAFTMMLKDLFVWFGGNLDSLGGLSPISSTVGQERLLTQAASKQAEIMQDAVVKMSKRLIMTQARYLYTDPLIELPLTRRLPGAEDISVNFLWGPERRRGDFLAYNFSINPYSNEYLTPQVQLQRLMAVVGQFIVPLMPMISSQGIGINFEKLLKQVFKLSGIENLDDVLLFMGGEAEQERGPVGDRPMKSPMTHRVNERVNRPGAIREQQSAEMIQALLGRASQPNERRTVGQMVG